MGDGSSYQAMLSAAQVSTEKVAGAVQVATQKIEDISKGMQTFASSALNVLGMLGAATTLTGAFNAFAEGEKTQIRLRAAIEASGQALEPTIARYRAFADQISRTTLTTRGAVYAMAQQGAAQGLSTEQTENAIKNSIAMAAYKGGEAQSYMRAALAMEQGNMRMAQSMLLGRGAKSQGDAQAKVQGILTAGMKVATAEMGTTSGRIAMLQRSFKQLSKEVGGLVAEVFNPLLERVRMGVEWFNNLDPLVRKVTVGVVALFAAMTSAGPILRILAPAFSLISIALGPIGLVIGGVVAAIAVFSAKMGGLKPAWEAVKDGAKSAWDWVQNRIQAFVAWAQPVWKALKRLFVATWEAVQSGAGKLWAGLVAGFGAVKDWLLRLWASFSASTGITWDGVRDTVVGVINFVTLVISNLGAILSKVWDGIKYGAGALADALTPFYNAIVEAARVSAAWIKDFIRTHADAVFTIGVVVGAVIILYGAFRLLLGVAALLKVQQVASLVLWGLWTVAVLTAKVATLAFYAVQTTGAFVMGALSAVLNLSNIALAIWTPITLAATAATWLFNAAVAVLSAETVIGLVVGLGAAIVLVGALGFAMAIVSSAFSAAVMAGGAVLEVLSQIPTTSGPLLEIGNIIGGIVGAIKEVVAVAQEDMPGAWELIKAHFAIVVEQIKAILPPLWEFIKSGSETVWDLVVTQAREGFKLAFAEIKIAFGEFLSDLAVRIRPFHAGLASAIGEAGGDMAAAAEKDALRAENAMVESASRARREMLSALNAFAVVPTAGLAEAEKQLEKVRDKIEEDALWRWLWGEDETEIDKLKKKIEKLGFDIGSAMSAGVNKGMHKWDAAIYGSAEALYRISEYTTKMTQRIVAGSAPPNGSSPGTGGAPPVVPSSGPATTTEGRTNTEFLRRIAAATERTASATPDLAPADLP